MVPSIRNGLIKRGKFMKKFFYRVLVIVLAVGMLTPTWLAKAWAPTKAEAAAATIKIDDEDAGYTSTGAWADRSGDNSGYNNDYKIEIDDENLAEPPRTATWTPTIVEPGVYQVAVRWSARDNRGTSAKYQINYAGGVDEIVIDQTKKADSTNTGSTAVNSGWKIIGSYDFVIGTSGYVKLTESAEGRTVADAVRFVHNNAIPSIPNPESPVAGLITNNTTIDFSWIAAADIDDEALTYDFELFNSDNELIDQANNLEELNYAVGDLVAGDYTWRIRSYDGEDYSEWSELFGFSIDLNAPDRPVAAPAGNTYYSNQVVSLSALAADLDAIYYTLDGTDPLLKANRYSGPVVIDKSVQLKAVAFDKAGNSSTLLNESYIISAPVITGESVVSIGSTSATITWTTDHESTSRVVFDTVSHLTLGSDTNYGYAFSTQEDSNLVRSHSVVISGLKSGTKYYFRTVSHGSPEAVSAEYSLTTTRPSVVTTAAVVEAPVSQPVTPQIVISQPTVEPAPVEQGEIKGTETDDEDSSEDINWTPWIILFILIILAGAATGGYFYWFGKDDEEEIVSSEVIEKTKKTEKTAPKKKATSAKQKNRW